MESHVEWMAISNGKPTGMEGATSALIAPMTLLGPWAFSPLSGPYDGFVSFSRHPMRGRVETPGRRAWFGVVWGSLGWFGMVWGGLGLFGMVWDGSKGFGHGCLLN